MTGACWTPEIANLTGYPYITAGGAVWLYQASSAGFMNLQANTALPAAGYFEEDTAATANIVAWKDSTDDIYMTTDTGGTWTAKTPPVVGGVIKGIRYVAGVVWCIILDGANSKLYEKTGADSWTKRADLTTRPCDRGGIVQGGLWYYTDSGSGDIYSVQLSNPYTETQVKAASYVADPVRQADNKWYMTMSTGGHRTVYYSANQGAAWTEVTDASTYSLGYTDGTYIYCYSELADRFLVRRTNDDGTTWETVIDIPAGGTFGYLGQGYRSVGGTGIHVWGIAYTKDAGGNTYGGLVYWGDVGAYFTSCIIKNTVNPVTPRICTIQCPEGVIKGMSTNLVYTVQDAAAVERFKGRYLSSGAREMALVGVDEELWAICPALVHPDERADVLIDACLGELSRCTAGTTDEAAATTYKQTWSNETTIIHAIQTYAWIGLGLIRVTAASAVEFKLWTNLDASGRTLTYGTDAIRLSHTSRQNSRKYDKFIVIGANDSNGPIQKTLGSGDNKLTLARLDLHDPAAVTGLCTALWAVLNAADDAARIYEVDEWSSTWMAVGDTVTVSGLPGVPYSAAYIVLGAAYNLCSNHAKWRIGLLPDASAVLGGVQAAPLVKNGLSDSVGGTASTTAVGSIQEALGVITGTSAMKGNLKLGDKDITTTTTNTSSIGTALVALKAAYTRKVGSDDDLTLAAGTGKDVIIDADGTDVILKDDGTEFGRFTNDSGDLLIDASNASVGDLTIKAKSGRTIDTQGRYFQVKNWENNHTTIYFSGGGAAKYAQVYFCYGTGPATNKYLTMYHDGTDMKYCLYTGTHKFQSLDSDTWRTILELNAPVEDAVNHVAIQDAATNNPVEVQAAGSDANIDLKLVPKGSGVIVADGDIHPITDDTYYLGKNDDDTPKAWKGLILKDTANGKYYRIEVTNGTITATDLTD